MDRDGMTNLYRGPSIDASYQVSVHLAEWGFQRRRLKMWKVNGRRTPSDGKSSHCLWQGELKMYQYLTLFSKTNIIKVTKREGSKLINTYILSLIFLCENGFLRAILHQSISSQTYKRW